MKTPDVRVLCHGSVPVPVPVAFALALALVSLAASACGAEREPHADAASLGRLAVPSAQRAVPFVARGGELVARAGSHATLLREAETRIEGPNGRLLTLGAARALRGASRVRTAGAPAPAQDASGHGVRSMGPGVTEHFVTTPLGTEQSWRLESQPAGAGALAIVVPVVHGRFLGSDARGLRFVGDGGEVLYSHATFIDAAGTRTPVAATFVDGTIVLRVDADTLADARYPAVLDPTIAPSVTFGGAAPGAAYPAFGDQRAAAIGRYTDALGLVAYVDLADPNGATLDAVRIDATGAIVGSAIRIASSVTSVRPPAIGCNASQCYVAYEAGGALVGVRVDASGVVLDATPVAIAPMPNAPIDVAVRDEGTGRIVVWSTRTENDPNLTVVRARRVGADGVAVGAGPIDVGTSLGLAEVAVATFAGTTVIAWDEVVGTAGRLLGVRFDAALTPLDAVPVTLVDAAEDLERSPQLVDRGTDLLLVYARQMGSSSGLWFHASVLGLAPALTLGAPVQVGQTYQSSGSALTMAAVPLGTSTQIMWTQGGAIGRGTFTAAFTGFTAQYLQGGAIAFDGADVAPMSGNGVIVASYRRGPTYSGQNTNGWDVQITVLGTGSTPLTRGASSARVPEAAYGPSGFVVSALMDEHAVGAAVGAMRISSAGAALDATPTVVVSGTFTATREDEFEHAPASFLGLHHLVLWRRRAHGSAFDTVTGEMAQLAATDFPAVGPVRTLAGFWLNFAPIGGVSTTTVVHGTSGVLRGSVTANTTTGGPTVSFISSATSITSDGSIAIASTTGEFVVVTPTSASITPSIYTSSPDGVVTGALGTRSILAVRRNAVGGTDVQAILLNQAGSAVTKAAFLVHGDAGAIGSPRVVFDGTYYDVFYVRNRTLYLVRVDEDGGVRDATPSVVATGVYDTSRVPALATDRAGKVLVAYEHFDPTPGVRALRISAEVIDWNGTGSGAVNGTACTSILQCASGICVDGVCCNGTCGFGAANDCQACSPAANGTSPSGTCGPASAAVTCRGAAGVCDVADTCNGVSTTCPADAKVAAGTVCGALSAQPCETAQTCNGVSNVCQAKAPAQGSPLCRAASGPCDVEELCNGTSTACPADAVATTSVSCRAASGVCDVADSCNGVSKLCPADAYAGASVVCRPATGICDRADTCDGLGVTCPADAPAANTVVCRVAALPCDAPETCDGTSFVCPSDLGAAAGVPCRAAVSACDVAEACDGVSLGCPADAFAPATTSCRAAVGPCDLAELCTGAGPTCPPLDARKPAGTVCRASAGVCDVAEVCDGASTACAIDVQQAVGTVCRPAAGLCDTAEACSGASSTCPRDRMRVDGSGCGDGRTCNGDESCRAGACVAGEALVCAADSACLETTGECAVRTRPGGAAGCAVGPPSSSSSAARNEAAVVWGLIALAAAARRAARRGRPGRRRAQRTQRTRYS